MQIRFILYSHLMLMMFVIVAQVNDDFSDGDFTNNPVWSGDIEEFQITTNQLNSNGPGTSAELYLSTLSTIFNRTTWEFYIQIQGSAPSGSNKVRVFLMSDISDLVGAVNGYYLEIGQTGDDFLNLKRSVSGSGTKILSGIGTFNTQVRVKIERSDIGEWTLYADHSGGTSYIEEGSVIDDTFQSTSYFGLVVNHTSTRNHDYFFDDFKVDQVEIDSLSVLDNLNLEVFFNQAISQIEAEDPDNYFIPGLIISSTSQISSNHVEILLDSSTPLTTGIYSLNVQSSLTKNDPATKEFGYLDLELQSLLTLSDTKIQLTFNDNLDLATAEDVSNYSIDNGIGQPTTATLDEIDKSIVNLTLSNPLVEGTTFQLSISDLENGSQNSVLSADEDFTFVVPLVVDSAYLISKTELVVEFNKPLGESLAETPANYTVNTGVGNPNRAVLQPDLKSALLTFSEALETGNFTVTISNLEDTEGNVIDGGGNITGFSYNRLETVSVAQKDETSVQVKFNQRLEISSAETVTHYTLTEIGNPSMATYQAADSSVTLTFDQLYNTVFYLTIAGVENELENALANGDDSLEISIAVPTGYRSVIINELLPDPTPVVGLPDAEYAELYNPSAFSLDLNGFLLNGERLPPYILGAGDYVVITDDANIGLFTELENIISVTSFDALTNGSDTVILRDQFGDLLDSISYNTGWYRDELKDDGGYGLELINPFLPCSDETNWTASNDITGGTPGSANSALDTTPDILPPFPSLLEVTSGAEIEIQFNEPVSSADLNNGSVRINGFQINELAVLNYRRIAIQLNSPLVSESIYQVYLENIADCSGNISTLDSLTFYYDTTAPSLQDIVILSDHEVAIRFHEPLDESVAEDENNYLMDHQFGFPSKAILQDSAANRVHLTFDPTFQEGTSYQLSISGIRDTLKNAINNQQVDFAFQDQVDSVYVIASNLIGVRLTNIPESVDQYAFRVPQIGDFPASAQMDEDDPVLVRLAFEKNLPENKELGLYMEGLKEKATGEVMITPSKIFVFDTRAPGIERVEALNEFELIILFSEAIKLQTAFSALQYELENNTYPFDISSVSANQLQLTFEEPFLLGKKLDLKVKNISDVYGNSFATRNTTFVYDPQPPAIEKGKRIDEYAIRLYLSEKLDTTSCFDLWKYQLEEETPIDLMIQGPDSVQVVITYMAIPEMKDTELQVFGLADQAGNTMDTTLLTINTLDPVISSIVFPTDSTFLISFSKPMSMGVTDQQNYLPDNFEILDVKSLSPSSVECTLVSGLLNGDTLDLELLPMTDMEGNALQDIGFSAIFHQYLDAWKYIDAKTLELSFTTPFNHLETDVFQLNGETPKWVLTDNDDKKIVRLLFRDSIPTDVSNILYCKEISDQYGRRIPDQEITIRVDKTPPKILKVISHYLGSIEVIFDEVIDGSIHSIDHFEIIGLGHPLEVVPSTVNSVTLVYPVLNDGAGYELVVTDVLDAHENLTVSDTLNFFYEVPYLPHLGEIVINEMMVDPTPGIGLAEEEYIELYSLGEDTINLQSLYLADASTKIILPDYDLPPYDYVVLSTNPLMGTGSGIQVSGFPTLGNTQDSLTLVNLTGEIIDQVVYSRDWYADTEKDDGGYSLEMINPFTPCPGIANWKASIDPDGGTPGEVNSVYSLDPDEIKPFIQAYSINENQLILHFSESLDSISVTEANYTIDGLEMDQWATDRPLYRDVSVRFKSPLVDGQLYTIEISGISDCTGNVMDSENVSFGYGRAPGFNELLITEIMSDPEPPVGLPNSEYLELFNASDQLISLDGVELTDATGSVKMPSITLSAKEQLIICPNSAVEGFKEFGNTVGISGWLSLNNTGEMLTLLYHEQLIFTIVYQQEWHEAEKGDGGISLEMKDTSNPCAGRINWGSSIGNKGGTPGTVNSIREDVPDHFGPELLKIEVLSPTQLKLIFNEPLMWGADKVAKVTIHPSELLVSQVKQDIFQRDYLEVTLIDPLDIKTNYTLSLASVSDCSGNEISENPFDFVLPEPADSLDILINEVLFNPRDDGVDFVEITNRSDKNINLKNWKLGRKINDMIDAYSMTISDLILPAGNYLALTSDADRLAMDYPKGDPDQFLQMDRFPVLPNEAATIVLLNPDDEIYEELTYHEDMHFSLLTSVEGVSLERISLEGPTQDTNNWQSAASTAGYATPGDENSQHLKTLNTTATLVITPKVFVPANHGSTVTQDFTTINYQFGQAGKLANVNIYNRDGKVIKSLANGTSLDTYGFFKWDGLTDRGMVAMTGIYLIVFEVYDASGQRNVLKETVVVGR